MVSISSSQLLEWQKRLALVLIVGTPLLISPATYDSYLLPKFAWVTFLAAIWLWMLLIQCSGKWRMQNPIDLPIMGLSIVFIFSVLVDFNSALQIKALVIFGMYITLFYGFRWLWSNGLKVETITQTLLVTAVILSLYGIAQDFGWDFVPKSGGVRDWRAQIISTVGNPNFLGGYLGYCLPLFIAYALRRDNPVWKYALISLSLVCIVACMTVTFCVGVTVGLIIAAITGILMMLITRTIPMFNWARGIILFILLLSANLWYTLDNPYNSHGGSIYLEAKSSPHWASGMGARNFIWKTTRIMIDENPATGIGFGNYLSKSTHYQGINYQRYGTAHDRDYVMAVDQPHFQLLETASECGPLGVFVLFWVFCIWIRAAVPKLNPSSNKHIKWQPYFSALVAIEPTISPFNLDSKRNNKRWFAWGTFLGLITAIGHTFSSFPFHLPASSLLIVIFASWFFAKSTSPIQTQFTVPIWKLITTSLISFTIIIFAILHVLSDMYLRAGVESNGVTSIANLQQAIRLNPHQHIPHFMLANRYIQLGWYDQALEEFQHALRYQEDLKSYEYMARIHSIQQNWDKAIATQKRVIELNPVFPGHYRDLIKYMQQAEQTEGIELLEEKAKQLDEESAIKYSQ